MSWEHARALIGWEVYTVLFYTPIFRDGFPLKVVLAVCFLEVRRCRGKGTGGVVIAEIIGGGVSSYCSAVRKNIGPKLWHEIGDACAGYMRKVFISTHQHGEFCCRVRLAGNMDPLR